MLSTVPDIQVVGFETGLHKALAARPMLVQAQVEVRIQLDCLLLRTVLLNDLETYLLLFLLGLGLLHLRIIDHRVLLVQLIHVWLNKRVLFRLLAKNVFLADLLLNVVGNLHDFFPRLLAKAEYTPGEVFEARSVQLEWLFFVL